MAEIPQPHARLSFVSVRQQAHYTEALRRCAGWLRFMYFGSEVPGMAYAALIQQSNAPAAVVLLHRAERVRPEGGALDERIPSNAYDPESDLRHVAERMLRADLVAAVERVDPSSDCPNCGEPLRLERTAIHHHRFVRLSDVGLVFSEWGDAGAGVPAGRITAAAEGRPPGEGEVTLSIGCACGFSFHPGDRALRLGS